MNRNENLVSVIIPCYNHGNYLYETLDSVHQQTYQNYEIIIVDDGSDDEETKEVLKELEQKENMVLRKRNGGVSSARNFGIEKSSGQFILTLDADDKFAPDFTEKAIAILNSKEDVGMVTSYLLRFTANGICGKGHPKGGDVTDFLSKNNSHASVLFRYQCWVDAGGYDEIIPGHSDWEFNLNITKHGWLVYSIPEYLSYYRDVEGSEFDKVVKKRPDIVKYMAKKHYNIFQKHFIDIIYEKELEIKKYKDSYNMYKNSTTQKVGNAILKPLRWFK